MACTPAGGSIIGGQMASGTYITEVEPGTAKDEESKRRFQESVEKLNLLIHNIDNQFEKVLGNHEQDFIAAYKVSYTLFDPITHKIFFDNLQGHMKKVKEELKHLKMEAEQAAGLLKNDTVSLKLQE